MEHNHGLKSPVNEIKGASTNDTCAFNGISAITPQSLLSNSFRKFRRSEYKTCFHISITCLTYISLGVRAPTGLPEISQWPTEHLSAQKIIKLYKKFT